MRSIKMLDLINLLNPKAKIKVTGIRPGEKLHESLFSIDESRSINQDKNSFVIYSENLKFAKKYGLKLRKEYAYISSDKNSLNKKKISIFLKRYLSEKK